ncbi:hypothetical protein GCM10010399_61000 [Dactylosporangium fulvum]|uniref:DUF11 domain-containing protein n=1 Tax=Dactylosporangium fulvum TaxID=53359 RepID=A0ABY5VZX4_9ACTN|nr:hypothetical protein [Dactylosporangium fulvum]UWP83267.1 hypothetical protein Dfulv_02890 [Dactylosporangium fulvum]
MSDFDLDNLLAGAVDDYREHTVPQIQPAGTAAARTTATRRKRVHAMAVSALALVVVGVPMAVYAADNHHNGPPNITGSPGNSAPPETSAPPSAAPSETVKAALPPAPVTEQDITNGTLDIPAWPSKLCVHGKVTVRDGKVAGTADLRVVKIATVDLDKNGSADAVVIFRCNLGDPPTDMAVAFRRAADGSIETMGTVARGINQFRDVRAGAAGTVELQVSDQGGSDDIAVVGQVVQWRTYGWTGTRFDQADGPTAFNVAMPKFTATLSDLTFEPAVNGQRNGTMTVTLHNGGSTTISDASIVYQMEFKVTSPKCDMPIPGSTGDPLWNRAGRCRVQPIAPGATATVTFQVTASDSSVSSYQGQHFNMQSNNMILVQLRVGERRLATQPALSNLVVK